MQKTAVVLSFVPMSVYPASERTASRRKSVLPAHFCPTSGLSVPTGLVVDTAVNVAAPDDCRLAVTYDRQWVALGTVELLGGVKEMARAWLSFGCAKAAPSLAGQSRIHYDNEFPSNINGNNGFYYYTTTFKSNRQTID